MRIGLEIEFTGNTRVAVAKALAELWDTKYEEVVVWKDDSERLRHVLYDPYGAMWKIVRDKSIKVEPDNITKDNDDYKYYQCELVCPILDSDRRITRTRLREVLEIVKGLGCKTNLSCGIHIHIDMLGLEWVDKLFRRVFDNQKDLASYLHIPLVRKEKYCILYPDWFIDEYKAHGKFNSLEEWKEFFFSRLSKGVSIDHERNPARYYIVNMHSLHTFNTIEFRPFNSTLDIDTLCEYINLVERFSTFEEFNQLSA